MTEEANSHWGAKRLLKVLVTGAGGFIGSNLVRKLSNNYDVIALDKRSHTSWSVPGNHHVSILETDLNVSSFAVPRLVETVFHFAANPEVRPELADSERTFRDNIQSTFRLLESIRKADGVKKIIFASTSAVYGDARVIPTPEDYSPLFPISLYGSSKLACESLMSGYANSFEQQAIILRLANVVGPGSGHGIITDVLDKLRRNPKHLEILGDGAQVKSYVHISDCIDAIIMAWTNSKETVGTYNIGSDDQISVKQIVEIICEELELNPRVTYTGGVRGGRGWVGDVKTMLLDCTRLKQLGWKARYNSEQAIRKATSENVRIIQGLQQLS